MARPRVEPPQKPGTVVASAVRLGDTGISATKQPKAKAWQDRAWYFYDTIGEFRFAANWVGNLLSRATLYATRDVGDGPQPVASGSPADEVLDELFGDSAGREQMLHDIGVAYTVAGECYIVGWEENKDQVFTVTSPTDLKKAVGSNAWKLNGEELPAGALVIRMWRPHPRKRQEPDAPARAALPILQEIEYITERINAEITSRLTGAGVYWIPNEIAVSPLTLQTPDGKVTTGLSATSFSTTLMETMEAAIQNRSDASAMVPIVVTADGDQIANVRHTTFWSDMSEHLLALREAAIKRLALSLDMPPEVLTGMGEANHWSAWQVDESAIKSHSEPLLRAITNDLAKGYLRPALVGEVNDDEVREYGIGADTSEMRLRPNRSKEAFELYDRGELNGAGLRRETGFDAKGDKPSKAETKEWFTRKAASGSTTPEIVVSAMRMLGVDFPEAVVAAPTTQERPTPSLEDHPVREIPEAAAVDKALIMASEVLVFRALERAGNRLRTKTGTKFAALGASEVYMFVPCSSATVDGALEDAWSNVDRFAPDLGVTTESLIACLDGYCRVLLTETRPHSRALLVTHLSQAVPARHLVAL